MKIAIIGAGTIGLYIGNKLQEKGHKVSIFEKKDNVYGKICSGLISARLFDFIEGGKYIKKTFRGCLIHTKNKITKLEFRPVHYLIDRDRVNKDLLDKFQEKGGKIYFKHFAKEIPFGFDRIILCDGASSFLRTKLKFKKPEFYLGAKLKIKGNCEMIETWSLPTGFAWKIPGDNEIEYGIMGKADNLNKDFFSFLKQQKISFNKKDIEYAIIPQGLVISDKKNIALCGDCAGLTKPWSGGGVIWGLTAAKMLVENIEDLDKYNEKVKEFEFLIAKGRIVKKLVYYVGEYLPFLVPEQYSRDNDFPMI